MTVHRSVLVWVSTLLIVASTAGPLGASEARKKIADLAGRIRDVLKQESQSECAVGEFTGPTFPPSSAGPLIQSALIDEMKKIGVGINEAAFVSLKGEYLVIEDERDDKHLTIRLVVIIRHRKGGRKIDELPADIGYDFKRDRATDAGNVDLIKLLALNADLSQHRAPPDVKNEKLKQSVETPSLHLEGTKIQVKKGAAFAVEILVGTEPRQPHIDKKQAFVQLKKGEEYLLRLHNTTSHEAAVSITIDGVDAFQFYEPAAGRPTLFLVGAGKTRTIRGWARDTNKVSAFLVGSYADSVAYRALRGSASIGTITVCFHASWEKGKTPPEYQGGREASDVGTTLGRDIAEKSRVVPRTIGPLLEAVSIRYNR